MITPTKTVWILAVVLFAFLLFGCIQLPKNGVLGIGGNSVDCSSFISPSYLEIVKNKTSNSYYAYAILTDKCGQYQEIPAQMNFTIVSDGQTAFSKSLTISKSDYKTYYSRITKKQIGGAIIVDIPNEVITSNKNGYIDLTLKVVTWEGTSEKTYEEPRSIKINNIPEVK